MKTDQSYGVVPYLVDEDNIIRYLVIHHVKGHWDFPKGHPEIGEDPLTTAKRELAEETNLSDLVIHSEPQFHNQYQFTLPNSQEKIYKTATFFLGKVITKPNLKLQEQEVDQAQWATFDEALQIITFDNAKDLLHRVNTHLQNHDQSA